MQFKRRQNIQESDRLLVLVGSKNPVKIQCTEDGFVQAFNRPFLVEGINAHSGVSDQPVGDQETLEGAKNRAIHASQIFPEANYWVGIEGGIDQDQFGMNAFAWVYIIGKDGKSSQAKTGTFYLPKKVAELVNQGMELGKADDVVFDRQNSKQESGSVGILTHGVVSRAEYYRQSIILALIPFVNSEMY